MEKEAGGGIGMGNTCKSMADSYQCMAETTTILWGNWPPANEDKWGKKFMKVPMNIEKTKQKWGHRFPRDSGQGTLGCTETQSNFWRRPYCSSAI